MSAKEARKVKRNRSHSSCSSSSTVDDSMSEPKTVSTLDDPMPESKIGSITGDMIISTADAMRTLTLLRREKDFQSIQEFILAEIQKQALKGEFRYTLLRDSLNYSWLINYGETKDKWNEALEPVYAYLEELGFKVERVALGSLSSILKVITW